jgi:hypothetical protein
MYLAAGVVFVQGCTLSGGNSSQPWSRAVYLQAIEGIRVLPYYCIWRSSGSFLGTALVDPGSRKRKLALLLHVIKARGRIWIESNNAWEPHTMDYRQ